MMHGHVLATFTHRDDALAAVERARQALPKADIHVGDIDDALDAMVLGQRAEMSESIPAVSVGVFSGPMARGALIWGLVGLVVGALISVPAAAVADPGGFTRWELALFFALAGALGLSSATFVLGAARRSVKEGETMPEDPTAVVRVDDDADRADEVIQLLVEAGARSARLVEGPVDRPATGEMEPPHAFQGHPEHQFGAGSDYTAGFRSDPERRPRH